MLEAYHKQCRYIFASFELQINLSINSASLRKATLFDGERLEQVVAECYVFGASTRRVDSLVKVLGLEGSDKSRVSKLSKGLDARV